MSEYTKIENVESYAYDLSKNIISKGEIFDMDVLNQSIEDILSTVFGERLFNIYYGSTLPKQIFEIISQQEAERLLDIIVESLSKYEDRITVITRNSSITFPESNVVDINIVYVINKNNIVSTFERRLNVGG